MKLLFIIHSLQFGGAERQLVELIKGLNRHQYDLHLICLDNVSEGYTELLSQTGIKITYFSRSNKYDLRPVISIYRYIREEKIDLVHTFENLGSLYGLLAAKLSGRPVVCSAIRDAKDQNLKVKISKRIVARFSDILTSNSWAGLKNRFKTLKPHFRVVYNGVDFRRFEGEEDGISALKKYLKVDKYKHLIGMVASLSERKDHETLLSAVPTVLQAFPNTCFLLIGDGLKRKELEEKARKLGLEKNILFLGFRDDVDRIMRILDVFVLLANPNVHLEGISNAIIEAMAVEVPVVASEGGGTNELVKNDANGVLVPPKNPQKTAEAIIGLLGNRNRAERLARAAKSFVSEGFSLQRYVEEYETIYRELIPQER